MQNPGEAVKGKSVHNAWQQHYQCIRLYCSDWVTSVFQDIDSDQPMMQVGPYVFAGEYEGMTAPISGWPRMQSSIHYFTLFVLALQQSADAQHTHSNQHDDNVHCLTDILSHNKEYVN